MTRMIIASVILFWVTSAVSGPAPKDAGSRLYDRLLAVVDGRCPPLAKGITVRGCHVIPVLECPAYCGLDFHLDSSVIIVRTGYEGALCVNHNTGTVMAVTLSTAVKGRDTSEIYAVYFYTLEQKVWKECRKPFMIINGKCPK